MNDATPVTSLTSGSRSSLWMSNRSIVAAQALTVTLPSSIALCSVSIHGGTFLAFIISKAGPANSS